MPCDLPSHPPSKLQKFTTIKRPFGCKSSQLLTKYLSGTELPKLGQVCEQMTTSHCKTFGGTKRSYSTEQEATTVFLNGFKTFYEYL